MRVKTTATCPMCCANMDFDWEVTDIPHFGEAMLISGVCSCGFRHTDTMLLGQSEPKRHTLEVESLEDLNARVIRSSSGTIRVPEMGVAVEPGYASESYVSNVEGVLVKIRDVVQFATRSARQACDQERTSRGEDILAHLAEAMEGRYPFTFILEDPLGNSAVVSERVAVEPLSQEEIDGLKTGMVILNLEDEQP
ncbi:MAG: ZPR1 zinc finger domain-containing protein [Methanosarcinales archaeon]|nr:ZPR1 zinc finger domain-containing protein [Methanosarcinales archaeon]